ncbi:UNVERIFIED_CONTAM: hypothetical protein Slati_4597800 [Sesamum latifolium]|uniref:Uncharacterized protein n=1 Tax=Sesamum latifolium TaxID=2727402 RepID=A0AAW2S206_9LAMI
MGYASRLSEKKLHSWMKRVAVPLIKPPGKDQQTVTVYSTVSDNVERSRTSGLFMDINDKIEHSSIRASLWCLSALLVRLFAF